MVQAIENWALLTCRLVRLRTQGEVVHLDAVVEQADAIDLHLNLFASRIGREITISLKGALPVLAAGVRFRVRVRGTGPGVAWGDPASFKTVD